MQSDSIIVNSRNNYRLKLTKKKVHLEHPFLPIHLSVISFAPFSKMDVWGVFTGDSQLGTCGLLRSVYYRDYEQFPYGTLESHNNGNGGATNAPKDPYSKVQGKSFSSLIINTSSFAPRLANRNPVLIDILRILISIIITVKYNCPGIIITIDRKGSVHY